jgi:hypothetical protein
VGISQHQNTQGSAVLCSAEDFSGPISDLCFLEHHVSPNFLTNSETGH